jgi:hypothetical protein
MVEDKSTNRMRSLWKRKQQYDEKMGKKKQQEDEKMMEDKAAIE